MKILIAGASGLIGRAAAAALRSDGHEVIRLVRREPSEADEVTWRPAAGQVPVELCRFADAIINLCGTDVAASRWTSKRRNEIRTSRIDTTQTLAKVFGAPGSAGPRPSIFVSASAIGIYGDRGNLELNESSGPGNGFLADLCRDWEGAAMTAAESGARVVCLRFGVVLSREGGAPAADRSLLPRGARLHARDRPPVGELDRDGGRRRGDPLRPWGPRPQRAGQRRLAHGRHEFRPHPGPG